MHIGQMLDKNVERKEENKKEKMKKKQKKSGKKGKKGQFLSIFHEKDGYLRVPFPDVLLGSRICASAVP